MTAHPELLAAIRKACPSAPWSRGVDLARSGAVVPGAVADDELELAVTDAGGLRTHEVSLFPEELDWSCTCESRSDCCEHVAAAIISVAHGDRQVREGAEKPGHVGYRFRRSNGRLWLARRIVHGDQESPLPGSLAAMARGKIRGPRFAAAQADLQVEVAAGAFREGEVPAPVMAALLGALRGASDVTLDGDPIVVGKPTTGMRVRVRDEGEGVRVKIGKDPAVQEIFDNGAVVRRGELRPLVRHDLDARTFETYRKGRVFGREELGSLVGDVLPRLRRALPVRVDTDRLPEARTARPRIQLTTAREGDALTVLPTIVYGDPPVARLDGDRLTRVGEGPMPIRNHDMERALHRRLEHGMGMEAGQRSTMETGDAIRWVEELEPEDPAFHIAGTAHRDFRVEGELEADLQLRGEADFDLQFRRGERVAPARAVLEAYLDHRELVPLVGGGFGRVPAAWLAEHGARVAALLDAREATPGGDAVAWVGDLAALCEATGEPPPPAFERLRPLLDRVEDLPEPALPADFTATLRPYQHEGVRWLAFHREAGLGALLADDMGLGKTVQALAVVGPNTLIVAPTSVLANWAAELARFRPELRVNAYHGAGRTLDASDVTLTTYALLRIDVDGLTARAWDTVILDEAQAIKNPDSGMARAAHRLQAGFRIALTGTPVENRLDDLWSQMQFLQPGLLGSRGAFRRRYGGGDPAALELLRPRIRPFVLRRRKAEVARDLPPRTDVVVRCELTDEERATYDAVLAATRDDVARRLGAGSGAIQILEALLRLRQAACHPSLLPGASASPPASSKLTLLLERLEEALAEGHRALVFSQWTSLLDLVEPLLRDGSMDFVRLDGSTRDRGAVVDAFQDPAGPPVMLLSLKAGGTGLNLTAADHVFLLDPWWNPAVEEQAADRAHRIGQDRPVLVHRLVAADTVEERILALQERKRQVAEGAVGDAAGGLTRDDLLELLQ